MLIHQKFLTRISLCMYPLYARCRMNVYSVTRFRKKSNRKFHWDVLRWFFNTISVSMVYFHVRKHDHYPVSLILSLIHFSFPRILVSVEYVMSCDNSKSYSNIILFCMCVCVYELVPSTHHLYHHRHCIRYGKPKCVGLAVWTLIEIFMKNKFSERDFHRLFICSTVYIHTVFISLLICPFLHFLCPYPR